MIKEDDDNTISTTTSNVNIDIVNAVRNISRNNNNNSTNNSSTNSPNSSLNNNIDQDTSNDTSRVLNNYSLEDPTFGSNLINLPLEQLYKSSSNSGNSNNNSLMLIHQNITLPNLNINQATNALNGNFSNFGYNLGDKIFDKKEKKIILV